jgi:hypothetical protein
MIPGSGTRPSDWSCHQSFRPGESIPEMNLFFGAWPQFSSLISKTDEVQKKPLLKKLHLDNLRATNGVWSAHVFPSSQV